MSIDKKDYIDYGREFEYKTTKTRFEKFQDALYYIFDGPVTWFREKIVEPNRKEYYWYHRQYPRVPTIDECYEDDPVCRFEADEQYRRDYKVDNRIIMILKKRYENCVFYEDGQFMDNTQDRQRCEPLREAWELAVDNWFIKYGELGFVQTAIGCLMKQKHRMIWERRYGPVGSGMNPENKDKSPEELEKEIKKVDLGWMHNKRYKQ